MAKYDEKYDEFRGIPAAVAGLYMKIRRKEAGLGQRELANRVDINNTSRISQYETGVFDWRKSKYAGPIMRELSINAADARRNLGVEVLLDSRSKDSSVPHTRTIEVDISSQKLPFLGLVQAVDHKFKQSKKQLVEGKQVEVPGIFLGKHNPADLFVLEVSGDSMTDENTRGSIPSGCFILVKHQDTATRGDTVVAWIKDFPDTEEGLGVLKQYRGQVKNDETVLSSYNREGYNFKANKYDMKIQGVVIAFWQVIKER